MSARDRIQPRTVLPEIGDQGDVGVEREGVTLHRADDPSALGPVHEAVGAAGCGGHRLRTASQKLPPPPTVPSALGEALTAMVYCLGVTFSVATRVVFPWPLVVLLKLILLTVPAESLSAAVVLTLKVMEVAFVVTVPDAVETVSQLGRLVIEYLRLPPVALSE